MPELQTDPAVPASAPRTVTVQNPNPADQTAWKPRVNPWLIAATVALAAFMEVLDTSIANVALPHIAGSLGASTDQSTWVLTSYLVSNAIVLPITGWLSIKFGRKKLLVTCIGLFTLASVLCGMATSLSFLIAARIFQGIGGSKAPTGDSGSGRIEPGDKGVEILLDKRL